MSAEIRHERVQANGLEFHVNACGESERLALCLHGFPELGLSWDAQLPALVAAGYPKIETPTLLIWGDADPVLTPDTLGDVDRWVADATVRYLHGVGHWTQQEAPDEVNEILCAWLASEEVSGAREPSPAERS